MIENDDTIGFIFIVITLLFAISIHAQQVALSRDAIINFTLLWEGVRTRDGRPKVPDHLLARLKDISLEEVWA